jgi:hypothetical protein
VDGSGMIRTQMRIHNIYEMVAMQGAPCSISPHNNNGNTSVFFEYKFYK